MAVSSQLGRNFGWLWAAFAVSSAGTWLAFDAFPLIAILVLHTGPAGVALLAAAGPAMGAALALPLGPWLEFRAKRPVLFGTDLLRCAVLATVPIAFAFHALTFTQLLIATVLVGAADIGFRTASGALLRSLVRPELVLTANGRLESTTWTTTALGPPLGGLAIGLFGPVITVVLDAVSYLLSALGLSRINPDTPPSRVIPTTRVTGRDLLDGWRFILTDPELKPLFYNGILVNALVMVSAPLMAVLMLGRLDFDPWQYGLAFGVPCLGGLVGARLAPRLIRRWGAGRTFRRAAVGRVVWPVGLAFVPAGWPGLALVMALQFGLVTSIGVFNPMLATRRLELAELHRTSRILTAWSISGKTLTAGLTAAWGGLAAIIGTRPAIALAGLGLLVTPLLLPRRTTQPSRIGTRTSRSSATSSARE